MDTPKSGILDTQLFSEEGDWMYIPGLLQGDVQYVHPARHGGEPGLIGALRANIRF